MRPLVGSQPLAVNEQISPMNRSLKVYRALAAALALSTAGAAWMVQRVLDENELLAARVARSRAATPASGPTPPAGDAPEITLVVVGERLATIERQNSTQSDISETYFGDSTSSMHMHVMGFAQTCPLHLHRTTEEATIIVGGVAEVTQTWGAAGALTTRQGRYTAGALVRSPAFCGHEFRNPSDEHMLGNLVIAAPPFDGNFYVRPEDPRMLRGAEPFNLDLAAAHARFASGAGPTERVVLPILQGRLSSLLLRGEVALASDVAHPALVYVVAGAGDVRVGGHEAPLGATHLVTLRARRPATLRARDGATLAAFIFHPHGEPAPAR